MSRQGVSLRQFAKLDGCSEMLVRRGIQQGKLIAFEDGTLDPALAKTPWRKGNIGANGANAVANGSGAGELLSFADAQQLKENNLARKEGYQALLRKLEHEVKSERLVDRERVETQVFTASREDRDAWLNWPSRVAPLIAASLHVDAVALAVELERHVREHLAERSDPRLRLAS